MKSDESHEEFFELCALSTTDQLGAPERRRLDEHLRECFRCSDMLAQYQAVLKLGIPLAVVGEEGEAWSETNWSIDEAEAALRSSRPRDATRADCGEPKHRGGVRKA